MYFACSAPLKVILRTGCSISAPAVAMMGLAGGNWGGWLAASMTKDQHTQLAEPCHGSTAFGRAAKKKNRL